MQQSDFESSLAALLARVQPGFRQLLGAQRLTGGASQETWRLEVSTDNGDRRLCLRRASGAVQAEGENLDPATEARLIMAAADAGVPEPEILHVLEPADELGEGFLMAWLEGEALGGRIAHSSRFADVRAGLAQQCGEILARIHSIEPGGLDSGLSSWTPAQLVEATWQQYQDFRTPQPMLDYTARWLLENLPPESPSTLVHGDFRNGNLMVGEAEGVVGVLDWELASIGDPVRDLGWACVNSWRFGKADLPVGGFGEVEDMLSGYKSVSGREIEAAHLNFWVVFGSFWWSVICLRMADSYRSGENPSVERPAIGRRASEGQADCVAMLLPGEVPGLPAAQAADDELPGLGELVGSVSSFLAEQVAGELAGANSYLARVAANSLAIAGRQLELGPALERAEQQRLATLLGEEGALTELRWRLVEELRGGLELDTPGLAEHLRLTVMGQLAVDQPGYAITPGLPLSAN